MWHMRVDAHRYHHPPAGKLVRQQIQGWEGGDKESFLPAPPSQYSGRLQVCVVHGRQSPHDPMEQRLLGRESSQFVESLRLQSRQKLATRTPPVPPGGDIAVIQVLFGRVYHVLRLSRRIEMPIKFRRGVRIFCHGRAIIAPIRAAGCMHSTHRRR